MLGDLWTPRAIRWLALPLAIGLTHVAFEDNADAKAKKTAKKKKGPSMDDNAGRDVDDGGTAPGTTDSKTESKTSEIEMVDQNAPKKPEPKPAEVTLEEEDAPPESSEPEAPPPPYSLNWLSLMIQQDLLVYTSTPDVCPSFDDVTGIEYAGHPGYSCRDAEGVHKGNVYHGAGNTVHGGLGLATLRINIGYDRVLASRLMLGARFGFLLLQAPGVTGAKAPKPMGGEARVAYYFGDAPFESRSFRPFTSFAVGFAEVDGKVSVTYYKDHIGYQSGKQGTLDVWRITGPGFVALSGGASYPFGGFMLSGEVRAQVMLGSFAFAPALALTLGYGL